MLTLESETAIRLQCRVCYKAPQDYDGILPMIAKLAGWKDVYEVHHGVRRSIHQWWSHTGLCPSCFRCKRKQDKLKRRGQ